MRPLTYLQIVRRYRKGYGRGELSSYRPWLEVRDVPSWGVCSRIPGQKTGRQHHLLSRGERKAFVVNQWDDNVVDLREQFPLWPIDETIAIAEEASVAHPTHPKGGMPVVMTTDLLLTYRDGSMHALAVKQAKALASARTRRKLLIEMTYWERRGVDWRLVIENRIPATLARNLEWLNECWEAPLPVRDLTAASDSLLDALRAFPGTALSTVCLAHDRRQGFEGGMSIKVLRHSLARKHWLVPLDEPLYRVHRPFAVTRLVEAPNPGPITPATKLAA